MEKIINFLYAVRALFGFKKVRYLSMEEKKNLAHEMFHNELRRVKA